MSSSSRKRKAKKGSDEPRKLVMADGHGVIEDDKTALFLYLFRQRWDFGKNDFISLEATFVTERDILQAIDKLKHLKLKATNAFNVMKDTLRAKDCNAKWPKLLRELRITARQVYGRPGQGLVFQFRRYKPDQIVAFPNEFDHAEICDITTISSLSVPEVVRDFANKSGSYVSRVLFYTELIRLHLMTRTDAEIEFLFDTVQHIEDNVKTTPEIDSVYSVDFLQNGERKTALISVEIKSFKERILGDQIRGQIAALSRKSQDKKSPLGYQKAVCVIAIALAPEIINGEIALCVYSLEPVSVEAGSQFQRDNAHALDFDIVARQAVRFEPALDIF